VTEIVGGLSIMLTSTDCRYPQALNVKLKGFEHSAIINVVDDEIVDRYMRSLLRFTYVGVIVPVRLIDLGLQTTKENFQLLRQNKDLHDLGYALMELVRLFICASAILFHVTRLGLCTCVYACGNFADRLIRV
jgi:hypothetical protein